MADLVVVAVRAADVVVRGDSTDVLGVVCFSVVVARCCVVGVVDDF